MSIISYLFVGTLKSWVNRLLGRPYVRGSGPENLIYSAKGRTIRIGTQPWSPNGYTIDLSRIISWEDKPEQVLSHSERLKVAEEVRAVLASQWNTHAEIIDS